MKEARGWEAEEQEGTVGVMAQFHALMGVDVEDVCKIQRSAPSHGWILLHSNYTSNDLGRGES